MPRKPDHSPATGRVLAAFEEACAALAPLGRGARLLLACSAGGDSMTLLDLAARQVEVRDWSLAVVHLDHRQRPESAAEAEFIRAQAALRGLPCFVERLRNEIVELSPLTEDVMRQARHVCWARFAHCWQADAILVAHQADDRAETFLIRLLAGSGPTGLAAVRPIQEILVPLGGRMIHGTKLTLARPLLGARREDMREYLRERGIEWREDPSNLDLATKRGWVRHGLLPAIRDHIGLDPTERIARAAELINAESEALGDATRWMLGQLAREAQPPALARFQLDHAIWRGAGPALRRQLLREWLWSLRVAAHPPGFEAVNEALAFVERGRPRGELRSIERMHLVHCKTSLLAFGPEIDAAARAAVVEGEVPTGIPRGRKARS